MQNQTAIYESLLYEQVLEEILNRFNVEGKVLILRVRQDIVQQACECDDQLSNHATNHVDTVLLRLRIADIVDFGFARIELILNSCSDSAGCYFFKENTDSMALSRSCTLLLSEPLLFLLLLL